MTEYEKVFLDTAPLIYFLDDDVNFGQKAKSVFEEIISNGKAIVSSAITCHEYLVFPYRTHNQKKIDVFFEFTGSCGIELIPVSAKAALSSSSQAATALCKRVLRATPMT